MPHSKVIIQKSCHIWIRGHLYSFVWREWSLWCNMPHSKVMSHLNHLRSVFIRVTGIEFITGRAPFKSDMTHSKVTWHIQKWHDTFKSDMTHSNVSRLDHNAFECAMSLLNVSFHLNESCHFWMCHVTWMCLVTFEFVMSPRLKYDLNESRS